MRFRHLASPALAFVLGSTACLPYTVGSTAQTIAKGRTTTSHSYYFIPNALSGPGDTVSAPMFGADREWRHGTSERSDIGLRVTSGLGAVMTYKNRFRDAERGGAALAYIVGSGIVNGGEHAHFEATLVASGSETSGMVPFGGLRVMQVVPISTSAVGDSPTIGGFAGMQFGEGSFILRPEIGVFYDRSALNLRPNSFIVVPAITLTRGRRR